MKKFYPVIAAALLAAGLCFGWSRWRASRRESVSFFAMDTPVTLTAYGPRAKAGLDAARARIKEIERELSVTDPESAVARLNAAGGEALDVGADAAALTAFVLRVSGETGGALDPTLYPILRAWGFTTEERRVPPRSEIDELRKFTGADKVHQSGNSLRLEPGTMIDFGAVGKGFAGDEAAAALRKAGVVSAVANLGGNVQTLGARPGGEPWRIGVRAPQGGGLLGVLETDESAVVTSGGYERFFTGPDGVLYWHILDPATGCPARSGVISATVMGASGAMCDALSTAFFVMGPEKATAYWRAREGIEFILLTDDGIWISEGTEKRFSIDPEFRDAKVTVVRR